MLHIIAYRLRKPVKDYSALYDAFAKLPGSWRHMLTSHVFIDTTASAAQLWEALKPHIDANDDMIVCQLHPQTVIGQIIDNGDRAWLNSHR